MAADSRFFLRLGPLPLTRIAEITGAQLQPGERLPERISDCAPLEKAGPDALAYCADRRMAKQLPEMGAGACFVLESDVEACLQSGGSALVVKEPQAAFAAALEALYAPREHFDSDQPVSPESEIARSAAIGAGAIIAPGAQIGEGARIGAHVSIGPGVFIGEGSVIEAGAVLGFCTVGRNVRIGANAVIGGIGFGVTGGPDGLVEMPHIGAVAIGDDARIGALTAIDRGRFGNTVIGCAAKIDNHCHIAHNVEIGDSCLIAAFAGISGSTKIGDGAMLGGRVGVSDHLVIGKGARLGADAAVMRDVPDGETWLGSPAKPLRAFFREVATLEKLANTASKRDGGTES